MWHIPKNVKPKKGLNVVYQFVGNNYIVKPKDLVRKTRYPNTYSDNINDDFINAMNWEFAQDSIPGWVGQTVGTIHRKLS